MTSEEIEKAVENGPAAADDRPDAGAETRRFFIFRVGEARYALPPEAIHEIVSDLAVFPLPACPPYVAGLINSHGTPHTAFDLRVLFENERHKASQFLVLNAEGDDVAFGCTDVEEIVEIPVSEVASFSGKDETARFCEATINASGCVVPVLCVREILAKLENDLG